MDIAPLLIVIGFVVLAVVTPRYGVDSRERGRRRIDDPAPELRRPYTLRDDVARFLGRVRGRAPTCRVRGPAPTARG